MEAVRGESPPRRDALDHVGTHERPATPAAPAGSSSHLTVTRNTPRRPTPGYVDTGSPLYRHFRPRAPASHSSRNGAPRWAARVTVGHKGRRSLSGEGTHKQPSGERPLLLPHDGCPTLRPAFCARAGSGPAPYVWLRQSAPARSCRNPVTPRKTLSSPQTRPISPISLIPSQK